MSINADWLTLVSGGGNLYDLGDNQYFSTAPGSATLGFTAETNTSSSSRTATITFSAGDITNNVLVTQAGISLSVSPTTVSVAAAGESFTVTVACDTDYSVDISDTWLTLNSNSSGTLSFTADANTSGSSRTATITITAGDLSSTVEVTQTGISLSVSPTTVSVAAAGESFTVSVTCDTDYSVNISDDWLTLESDNAGTLAFTAEANSSGDSRTATITAGDLSETVTVTQATETSYDATGSLNGYEYVDLGLSVMWATCNIGADSPEEYGNYYAWGETETKSSYTSSNSITNGVEMDDFSGDAEYDAATANWGSTWRMPTKSELEELLENCTWTWTAVNDVYGYKVTGTNGNSIFLPAAGKYYGSSQCEGGSGFYWSSSPLPATTTSYACNLNFGSSDIHVDDGTVNSSVRYYGRSVRPVFGDSSGDSGSSSSDDSSDAGDDDASGTINGYEYVDLGLSVKWATCNIGADSPEDYGNYYAWGEVVTKDTYASSNSVTYGVVMDDISGNATYDAATANWGSSWRLPTSSEVSELIDDCTWEWTTYNGVNGYDVIGTNGNSIFLPAAGERVSSSLHYAGSEGLYWSSTSPVLSSSLGAYLLDFKSSSVSCKDYGTRYWGKSVRPVSD